MSGDIRKEDASPGRLDQFWAEKLSGQGVTRSKIQEWIKAGLATVDGEKTAKPSFKLKGGESLTLEIPEIRATAKAEQGGGLTVLHRDLHLAVVDKEPGLTVHPAPSCPEGTLVNRLLSVFPEMAAMEGERPGIVHRIDKDTSGLLVVALSEQVRLKLSELFASREVKKTYLALAHGVPARAEGRIEALIGRDPDHKTRMAVVKGGRESLTFYRVVWSAPDGSVSLLEVDIATGRTHQIRVHMAHIGHPLVGDKTYGPAQHAAMVKRGGHWGKLASRQMLHAWKLSFIHPESGEELAFACPPPRDFWRLPLQLDRRMQRVGIVGLPGSGKSSVAGHIADRGWPVFSADACVAELYQPGRDGWEMLRMRYGGRFVPESGQAVDKKALFEAMRASETFRRELMELLYPMVMNRLETFWNEHGLSRAAFAEIPMLLEAGWLGRGVVDMVLGVSCPSGERHRRLARRGWDDATIATLESWQWPQDRKMAACRAVVDNGGDLADAFRQADEVLAMLAVERRGRAGSLLAWMRSRGYA